MVNTLPCGEVVEEKNQIAKLAKDEHRMGDS